MQQKELGCYQYKCSYLIADLRRQSREWVYFTDSRVWFVCKYLVQYHCVAIVVETQGESGGVIHR